MKKKKTPIGRVDILLSISPASPQERTREVRRIRKHLILKKLKECGVLSRIDLARMLDFNYRSTTLLVDEMVNQGLVIEEKKPFDQGRGRPPQPVKLNARSAIIMGLSFEGSAHRAAIIDLKGDTLAMIVARKKQPAKAEAWAEHALELATKALDAVKGDQPSLAGIGVVMPAQEVAESMSLMDKDKKLYAATPAGSVVNALKKKFNISVIQDFPSRAMMLGAHWFGVARSFNDFAYLNLNSSLTLGIMTNGRPLSGSGGFAGFIDPTQSESLTNKIKQGKLKETLGELLPQIAYFYNPEAIVIRDDINAKDSPEARNLQQFVQNLKLPELMGPIQTLMCDMEENAGPLGAAAMIMHRIYSPSHIAVESIL